MQELLGEMAESSYGRSHSLAGGWRPAVDVYETDQEVVIVVDLAGIRAEDVQVVVKGRMLRIAGVRRSPLRSSYREFQRLEIPQGPFERVIELPSLVDDQGAEARYAEGLLEILLPIKRPSHPRIRTAIGKESGSADV
jgi:HSP20 family protein